MKREKWVVYTIDNPPPDPWDALAFRVFHDYVMAILTINDAMEIR
jgi:hypothetical protein